MGRGCWLRQETLLHPRFPRPLSIDYAFMAANSPHKLPTASTNTNYTSISIYCTSTGYSLSWDACSVHARNRDIASNAAKGVCPKCHLAGLSPNGFRTAHSSVDWWARGYVGDYQRETFPARCLGGLCRMLSPSLPLNCHASFFHFFGESADASFHSTGLSVFPVSAHPHSALLP